MTTSAWATRATHWTVRSSFFWISTVLLALVVLFSSVTPAGTFLSTFNAQSILADGSVLLILATAATLVIISGGLDLSIGSVLTFSAVVGLQTMKKVGVDEGWTAIAAGTVVALGAGAIWGLVNGALIAYARLSAFVVTLGSFGAALGAARLVADGRSPDGGPPQLQQTIGLGTIAGIPTPFVIAGVVVCLFGVLLAQTRFGEHIYMIGSSEEAARRGGIPVRRDQLILYTISGALAGLAGVVDTARFDTASIITGHTIELIGAIAAVIIGGASLLGGVGTMAGTVVGVFIPTVLNNGLVILGVQRFWQDVAVGVILVAAVAFDQWRRSQDLSGSSG
jgi:ribose transport system permease protein